MKESAKGRFFEKIINKLYFFLIGSFWGTLRGYVEEELTFDHNVLGKYWLALVNKPHFVLVFFIIHLNSPVLKLPFPVVT